MNDWCFKLLYDGQCPFCCLEVRWLQRWNRHGYLVFEDISTPDFDPSRYGVTLQDLMGVIHGVYPDGRIVRKVEAFRQAYRVVGLGWLLAPTGWPVFRWFFDGLYEVFARNRVSIGRFFGRTCTTGTCEVASPQVDVDTASVAARRKMRMSIVVLAVCGSVMFGMTLRIADMLYRHQKILPQGIILPIWVTVAGFCLIKSLVLSVISLRRRDWFGVVSLLVLLLVASALVVLVLGLSKGEM